MGPKWHPVVVQLFTTQRVSKLHQKFPSSSSYDSKAAAILMALNFEFQSNLPHNRLFIASDSLSSLLAITEPPYNRNICPH